MAQSLLDFWLFFSLKCTYNVGPTGVNEVTEKHGGWWDWMWSDIISPTTNTLSLVVGATSLLSTRRWGPCFWRQRSRSHRSIPLQLNVFTRSTYVQDFLHGRWVPPLLLLSLQLQVKGTKATKQKRKTKGK